MAMPMLGCFHPSPTQLTIADAAHHALSSLLYLLHALLPAIFATGAIPQRGRRGAGKGDGGDERRGDSEGQGLSRGLS